MRGDAPLLVVVGEHELVSTRGPLAARHARHRWVGSQAVRAVLVLIVSLAFLAGCGGSDDERRDDRRVATGATSARASRRPQRASRSRARHRRARSTRRRRTRSRSTRRCGSFTVTLDHRARAEDGRVARRPRERGLLRRHDLPPRRPRLRDPGRRPDAVGRRRPGLLDGRRSAVRRGVHAGRRRDGEVAASKRRARREASSSSSRATDARPDARLRDRRRGHRGLDTVLRIDALGVGDGPPSQPVVVNSVTVGES